MGFSSSIYNHVHVPLLFFLLLSIKFSCCHSEALRASCKPVEREALLVFKGSLTDPSNSLSSWTGRDCCSWHGVGCHNVTGHVVELSLVNSDDEGDYNQTRLVGSEVSSALANLKQLEYLVLDGINFAESKIPDFFGDFKSLRVLSLYDTSFAGVVPHSLGNLSALQDLVLLDSDGLLILDNSQWLSRLTSLKHLQMFGVNLSEVPYALQNLTNLVELDMWNNHMSGHIPDWLSQLKNLESLGILGNSFSGSIPSSVCSMPNLESLALASNQLSGSIPACLGNVSSLSELFLYENYLSGHIPVWLSQLKNLHLLNLRSNSFSGSIPSCLGNMSNLNSLFLNSNRLTGKIPESFGQLSKLTDLDVSDNSLSGVVSENHFEKSLNLEYLSMGSNSLVFNMSASWSPPFHLTSLYLGSCQLGHGFPLWLRTQKALLVISIPEANISGQIPEYFGNVMPNLTSLLLPNNNIGGSIPTFLCEMKNLRGIDLSNNQLSGELSQTCWSKLKDMEYINLASNNIKGRIPSSIGHMSSLFALHLSKNEFYGELPQTMKNCKKLVVLDLADNEYSGSLPSWIGGLSSLKILKLRSNKFGGSLIPELCQLNNLHILDLAHNNFSSFIPLCFGNFNGMKQGGVMDLYIFNSYDEKLMQVMKGRELEYTKNLKFLANLDLSNNLLMGGIPEELTSLHGLIGLHLSNNQLTGEIPKMIGSLKSLDSLDLSNNRFSGPIPQTISSLGILSYLNISFNNLSGEIPYGHLQSFDASSYVGNPGLCGFPLDKDCSPQTPSQISGNNTHEVEDEDEEDVYFYVGIVVGSLLGFWGFWGVLLFKKTWRFTYFRLVDSVIVVVLSLVTWIKKQLKSNT